MGDPLICLICFDLNGTLIRENSWQNLNRALGLTDEEDLALLRLYQDGSITYQEGLDRLLRLYNRNGKFRKDIVEEALFQYSYCAHAKEIVSYLREKQYQMAIISGSFDILVEKVAEELRIPFWAANNRFVFDQNGTGTSIECFGNDDVFKEVKLEEMCRTLDIDITQCACVGDSENDRKIFAASQHGIALKGSPVEKDAWKVIRTLEDIKIII